MFNTIFAVLSTLAPKKDEKGATAVEYGLIVSLIAVAIIVAVTALGTGLSGLFDTVTGQL